MLPVAVVGDLTDPETGEFGSVALVPNGIGKLLPGLNGTVRAGGRLIATVGTSVSPHGNYTNPKLPGFNPTCAKAILTGFHSSATIIVCGQPVAVTMAGKQGTMASCTHYAFASGVPTVLIGGVA